MNMTMNMDMNMYITPGMDRDMNRDMDRYIHGWILAFRYQKSNTEIVPNQLFIFHKKK
jgi:hypothetical protein